MAESVVVVIRSGGSGIARSRRNPWRKVLTLFAVLAGLLAVAACGVPTESSPHPLPTQSSQTVAPPSGGVGRLTEIYLVRGESLVAVDRAVAEPLTLERVLQALLSGPTSAEAARGLRSAIPSTVMVHELTVRNDTVVVDLTSGLTGIDSQDQELALAQLVYTTTTWPGAQTVRVLVEGQAVKVPQADGTLTDGDLTRADYSSLLAR